MLEECFACLAVVAGAMAVVVMVVVLVVVVVFVGRGLYNRHEVAGNIYPTQQSTSTAVIKYNVKSQYVGSILRNCPLRTRTNCF